MANGKVALQGSKLATVIDFALQTRTSPVTGAQTQPKATTASESAIVFKMANSAIRHLPTLIAPHIRRRYIWRADGGQRKGERKRETHTSNRLSFSSPNLISPMMASVHWTPSRDGRAILRTDHFAFQLVQLPR